MGGPADVARGSLRPLSEATAEFEREYLTRALELTGGKKTRAAEVLGISRKNLWQKLKGHGLAVEEPEDA